MSVPYDKPLPKISREAKTFWAGLRQHKLLLQRCANCGRVRHYPRPLCDACYSKDVDWIESSGRGRIHSWTVTHHPPAASFAGEVPYILAIADMDEGVRVQARLRNVALDDVSIDMPVRAVFEDATPEVTLLALEPDPSRLPDRQSATEQIMKQTNVTGWRA